MFDETKHVMLQGSATMLLSHLPQLLEMSAFCPHTRSKMLHHSSVALSVTLWSVTCLMSTILQMLLQFVIAVQL